MPFGPFALTWRAPSPNPPPPTPLPLGITRTYIPTPSGPLELLSALPSPSTTSNATVPLPPLFFIHGGFGCAAIWLSYLQYFSARGYPCYALSLRGHGGSWYPGYWAMYFSPRGRFGEDLVRGVSFVQDLEQERSGGEGEGEGEEKVVLIAHSAGGALAQYVLTRGLLSVRAFCMCAAVPGFGSFSCYTPFALTAPIHFPYRLFHPRYILATTHQIQSAFFNAWTPLSVVQPLERLLSPYESMLWPLQMMPSFVDAPTLLSQITGWTKPSSSTPSSPPSLSSSAHQKITPAMLILAASADILCPPSLLFSACQQYRSGFWDAVHRKKIAGVSEEDLRAGTEMGSEGEWIRFVVVQGLAHHLMNESEWERGAEEICGWVRML
ncbi:alpha/beta-hydrolase [Amniculicola lignicola CBS 123094]|uniref:Alpha/beta-hydrolase n=1 Tax=Amniculicola lignicola CBS 123094 TaxID=1392246 RepID=A0A6A5VZC3_9PLEO|nr:alpha/beta-hydrolase [Amniculicola lignicola CBS 123094]